MEVVYKFLCSVCGLMFGVEGEDGKDPSGICPDCGKVSHSFYLKKFVYPNDPEEEVIAATFQVIAEEGVIFSGAR